MSSNTLISWVEHIKPTREANSTGSSVSLHN